jgi:hypothetical protein
MNGGIARMCAGEFQTIQDAMAGHKEADENALAALAVLERRLERIKSLGGGFSDIGFSAEVRKMRRNKSLGHPKRDKKRSGTLLTAVG